MSWPWARKVLVPVADAVTLDEAGGLGAEAAAELLEELQAVTSKAAQASVAQPATCRTLRAFVVNMDFHPCNFLSGSVSHLSHTTSAAPPWLGQPYAGQ
jgi:hypothetical protein